MPCTEDVWKFGLFVHSRHFTQNTNIEVLLEIALKLHTHLFVQLPNNTDKLPKCVVKDLVTKRVVNMANTQFMSPVLTICTKFKI